MTHLQVMLAGLSVGCAGMTILAHFADRRRLRRSRPDAVGFMPWPTISLLSTVGAIILAALALKAGG
jgi:hypothetical protein